jgi:hypothetical protein
VWVQDVGLGLRSVGSGLGVRVEECGFRTWGLGFRI